MNKDVIHWKFVTFITMLIALVLLAYYKADAAVISSISALLGMIARDIFRKETQKDV